MNGPSEVPNDLLTRLAPSGAEDFITKVFWWLLANTNFGNRFLERLMGTPDSAVPDVGRDCEWKTQKSYVLDDGTVKRPDMVCISTDKNTALIFEHKVGADPHDRQLENYRRIGDAQFDKSGLILITATIRQRDERPDRHLFWRDVYRWLACWLGEAPVADTHAFVARNFLELLEKQGLGPMEKITVEQLRAIPSAFAVERKLEKLVKRIAEESIWRDLVGVEGDNGKADRDKQESSFRWGRCGLYLLGDRNSNTWCPGVFVGVMQHSRNHGPESVNKPEGSGPVACLIVDVAGDWHGQYETSEAYSNLARAFRREWPGTENDDWQIHEYERNHWHPLAIYKPLAAVFRTARTGDEQADILVKELGCVARAVLGLEEFCQFQRYFADAK